jgi:predicted dehydrogenase
VTNTSPDKPLRIGLIGAGMIGKMRARALAQMSGEAVLVAVADPREDEARAIAGDGDVRVVSDGRLLAEDDGVDAVILSTVPALHVPLGLPCLQGGKHLLVEKPLASTVEECEQLVTAADDAGVRLATGYTLRQTPAARKARELVDSGTIGEVDHIRAFHGHKGGKDFGPDWITQREQTGGGTLMDNGIHVIDLALWFMDDIESTNGYGSNNSWHKPGCEDNGFVLMRDTVGRIASVQGSWTEWRGYGWRVEIFGTRGMIRFSFPPLWLTLHTGEPGHPMKKKHFPFPHYQVMERLKGWQWSLVDSLVGDTRDWCDAIREGREPPASGRDGLRGVEIALGIDFISK